MGIFKPRSPWEVQGSEKGGDLLRSPQTSSPVSLPTDPKLPVRWSHLPTHHFQLLPKALYPDALAGHAGPIAKLDPLLRSPWASSSARLSQPTLSPASSSGVLADALGDLPSTPLANHSPKTRRSCKFLCPGLDTSPALSPLQGLKKL